MTTLNFGVIKVFKSTLYTRHNVDLELNFGRTYSIFLKISEYDMNKFTYIRWVEKTPPWYVLINLNEYQEHIYIYEFWNFDEVSPTSGNRDIQYTRYIYDRTW